jgi:exportin-5
MQNFTWALHENCYSIIGAAASLLTPELYNSDMDFKTILNDLDCLPICKLRMILKCFLKPFIVNCPNEPIYYERLLVPILSVILPFMFSKMDSRWEEIKVRNMSDANDEPVEAELVEDEINRLLSREFIDFMLLMIIPTIGVSKTNDSNDESMSELNSEEPVLMSNLGNHLIQSMPNLFIISSAKTLSWLDTNVSLKSCQLNSTIFKKIIQENLIQSEDGANFLFEQILKGLNYFGEHDQNQAILLHLMLVLYENVVIKYGFYSVKVKLAELCECQVKVWDDFDAKFLIVPPNKQIIPEKRKKDRLKQIVSPLIGVLILL